MKDPQADEDFLPTSAPPPLPPPSPLEAENAELRRRLAEAERSAVQDERLLRQRASEDAEALQNEVKELRRRVGAIYNSLKQTTNHEVPTPQP